MALVDLLVAMLGQQRVVGTSKHLVLHVRRREALAGRPVDAVDHDVVVQAAGAPVDLRDHDRTTAPSGQPPGELLAELVRLLPRLGILGIEGTLTVPGEGLDDVVALDVRTLDGVPVERLAGGRIGARAHLDGPRTVLPPTLPVVPELLLGELRDGPVHTTGSDEPITLGLTLLLGQHVRNQPRRVPRRAAHHDRGDGLHRLNRPRPRWSPPASRASRRCPRAGTSPHRDHRSAGPWHARPSSAG